MSRKQLCPPPPQVIKALYAIGLGPIIGNMLLLLTTTGRKSGLARVTPLQYEEINGEIYIGAANGTRADWFKNILAHPEVSVRVKSRSFAGIAEPVTDPVRIADFLEYRLKRHPSMIGAILKTEGLPARPSREQLEEYASRLAMVIIKPEGDPK